MPPWGMGRQGKTIAFLLAQRKILTELHSQTVAVKQMYIEDSQVLSEKQRRVGYFYS